MLSVLFEKHPYGAKAIRRNLGVRRALLYFGSFAALDRFFVRLVLLTEVIGQIAPRWVLGFDELELSRTTPTFDLLFAGNRIVYVLESFKNRPTGRFCSDW